MSAFQPDAFQGGAFQGAGADTGNRFLVESVAGGSDVVQATHVNNQPVSVTQAGAEVLLETERDLRVEKAGAEVLYSPDPPAGVSQAGAEVLYQPDPLWTPPESRSLVEHLQGDWIDTFSRTEVAGWGTGEWGPEWEVSTGLADNFNVDSSRAEFLSVQGHNAIRSRLPFSGARPLELYFEMGIESLISGGSRYMRWELLDSAGMTLRAIEMEQFGDTLQWYLLQGGGSGGPDYIGWVEGTSGWHNTNLKVRLRVESGTQMLKVWPHAGSEPDGWQIFGGAPAKDVWASVPDQSNWGYDFGRAPTDGVPVWLQFRSAQNGTAGSYRFWVSTAQVVEGISGAIDEIDHQIDVVQLPGSLTENLTTTDTVGRLINRLRFPVDTVSSGFDWIWRAPDEEDATEYGVILYDWFDREEEQSLGVATSGWPYPISLSGTGSFSPTYLVSGGFAAMSAGFVDWRVPANDRVGVLVDWMVPVFGTGSGMFGFYGNRTNHRVEIWLNGVEVRIYHAFVNAVLPEVRFDLSDPEYEGWRGQMLRLRAIFTTRPNDFHAVKVWLAEEPEPEEWNQILQQGTSQSTIRSGGPIIELYSGLTNNANRSPAIISSLQIYDPIEAMPGGLMEVLRTHDSVKATAFRLPVDYEVTATDDVSTWIPDMVFARVESPQVVQPIDSDASLAEDAESGSSEIVVTDPAGTGTTAPIHVTIGGETYEVIAVNGNTLTLDRPLTRPYSAGTSVRIRPVPTSITVGGVDITRDVDFKGTRLTTFAGPGVGVGEIRVKDVNRTRSITTGAEIIIRHRGIRVWGGYVMQVERSYAFRYGRTGSPAARYLTIHASDYNILMKHRRLFNKADPLDYKPKPWPVGTSDATVIAYMIQHFLDLTGDGIGFDVRVSQSVAPYEEFQQVWTDGTEWMQGLENIVDRTRAVYYIDPDKIFRYVDDSTQQSRFGYAGVSDVPDGVSTIGYRNFELDADATKMVNDALVWGWSSGGQETNTMAFWRETEPNSVLTQRGRWQLGEVRGDMYKPESIKRRAETWVHGSAYNRRGHKDDKLSVRCTVFVPYFRVGDVVEVESQTFGFSDLIPVRGAAITFPTPFDIQMDLTISHELDPPWNTFEFWFPPPWVPEPPEEPPIIDCPIDYVAEYEPFGPPVAWVVPAPPNHESGWLVSKNGHMIGAGPPKADGEPAWVWISGNQNFKGHVFVDEPVLYRANAYAGYYGESELIAGLPGIPQYRLQPVLHRIQKRASGYVRYTFGSIAAQFDYEPATLETRVWRRFAVEDPDWSGMLEVTFVLNYRLHAWNRWFKYWMGGIEHGYNLPLGAEKLSFNDSGQDGDWPDPFHIEGVRDFPDLFDMTSDLINGTDEYDSRNHGITEARGQVVTKRIMPSGGSVQLGALYTGESPHEGMLPSNDWVPEGGQVVLTGGWYVAEVRRVETNLLVRDLDGRDDGTFCVSVNGSGDVTFPLQKTNHPDGVVYRFPSAYQPGSTRVFVDGVLQVRGEDYFEVDPAAGYIQLAYITHAPVTGSYWVAGASSANLSGLGFILPTTGPITGIFGPHSSLWPPYSWHGTYYPHFHNGTDFGVATGTPVYAAADGTAFWETQSAGGQMINIYHSPNIRTNYAHLSGRVVGHGAAVVQGQLIGYSGATGIVTGAHLHWGLVVNGIPEDPMEHV